MDEEGAESVPHALGFQVPQDTNSRRRRHVEEVDAGLAFTQDLADVGCRVRKRLLLRLDAGERFGEGRIRPVRTLWSERIPGSEDVPFAAEQGIGFQPLLHSHSLSVPSGTPQARVDYLRPSKAFQDQNNTLKRMVGGFRLADISDLPFDIIV